MTGESLDRLARARIFTPLGMRDSLYTPAKSLRARIAPTENDAAFRKRLVHGEVHDENAWAMGGVAGHAGLFSTAAELAAFCQMLLNGGLYAHQCILPRNTIEQFTSRQALAGRTRALGWTGPTEDSSSGRDLSAPSYCPTAFSGSSIWIDRTEEQFVRLLTNRCYPKPNN